MQQHRQDIRLIDATCRAPISVGTMIVGRMMRVLIVLYCMYNSSVKLSVTHGELTWNCRTKICEWFVHLSACVDFGESLLIIVPWISFTVWHVLLGLPSEQHSWEDSFGGALLVNNRVCAPKCVAFVHSSIYDVQIWLCMVKRIQNQCK